MNRHLQQYSALPTDALGPPMRAEPAKPADGAWKPLRPGYVSRVLSGGAVEVKRTDLPAQPPKQKPASFEDREQAAFEAWLISAKPSGDCESVHGQWLRSLERLEFLEQEEPAAESIITPLAPSAAAPIEWQSGAPPEKGWWPTFRASVGDDKIGLRGRFWNGLTWGMFAWADDPPYSKLRDASCKTGGTIEDTQWRGPRLVGADWPEPQA